MFFWNTSHNICLLTLSIGTTFSKFITARKLQLCRKLLKEIWCLAISRQGTTKKSGRGSPMLQLQRWERSWTYDRDGPSVPARACGVSLFAHNIYFKRKNKELRIGPSNRRYRELHGDKKSSPFPPRTQDCVPGYTNVPITAVDAVSTLLPLPRLFYSFIVSRWSNYITWAGL